MTKHSKMVTRYQLRGYNYMLYGNSDTKKLLMKLQFEPRINSRVSYIRQIYEIMNKHFNVFLELDSENKQILKLFDAVYDNSFKLITEIQEKFDGTKITSEYKRVIQEIEKYQIRFKSYVMTYLNNTLSSNLNDDVINVIYAYLY